MSLRLILTRHAKSSWDDPAADDHGRPLNDRGRRSARAIGAWLRQRGYVPAKVISSDARRTRETWDEIEAELASRLAPLWEPLLYHASPQDMLEVLRNADGASPVMIIGHNPGIGLMARALAHTPPHHVRFDRYPTGATCVLDFDAPDWSRVGWDAGAVVDFTVPRDLGVS